jgi:hypothetical protein
MLPVSGLGVSAVAGLFRTRRWGASPQYVVAAVLIAAGALWPIRAYLSYLSEKNPQDQEYRLVYDNSGKLPAGSVRLPRKTGCPHNIRFTPPNSAFKLGKGKQEFLSSDEKETVYVYSGLNCYAYPLLCHTKFSLNELGDALGKGIFNGPPELVLSKLNLDIPQGLTEACENVARRASRFIHWGDVSVEKQELPFIYYTKTTIPVGVWEIPPTTE